jgi:hypothetical protein
MRVTRSYWLGLGSGLILSAMLSLVISSQQGTAVIQQELTSVPPVKQDATTQPLAGGEQADPPSTAQPSESTTQPSQGTLSNTQSSTQVERQFIIPKGASSERIADMLVVQDFIKDKESFLMDIRQMGVERQFRAGTFTLSLGLTSEEVIRRLIKNEQ